MPVTVKSNSAAAAPNAGKKSGKSKKEVETDTTSFSSPDSESWLNMSPSELLRELQSNTEFNTNFFVKYAEIQEIVKQYKAAVKAERDAAREKLKKERAIAQRARLIETIQKIMEKDEDHDAPEDLLSDATENETMKEWIKEYRAKIKAAKEALKAEREAEKAEKEAAKQAKLEAKQAKDAETRTKLIEKMGKFDDAPEFDEDEISLPDLKALYKRTRLLASMSKFEDAPDFDEDEISTEDLNILYQRTRTMALIAKLDDPPEYDADTIELDDLKELYKTAKNSSDGDENQSGSDGE